MNGADTALVLIAAVHLDIFLGDPVYSLHPVRLIGRLIECLEKLLRRLGMTGLFGGGLLLVSAVAVAVGVFIAIRMAAVEVSEWLVLAWDIFIVYSCIALRDMVSHARPIARALRDGDDALARQLLGRIVGRKTDSLSSEAVARGAVESVAESVVDGFMAPIFWVAVVTAAARRLGYEELPAAVIAAIVYRTANTLDSMVGYRNEQYLLFGRISAKVDDALNYIPARLSLMYLWFGALVMRLDAGNGWRTAMRDRLKHASPNSAHSESFVAGALGVKLGGPTEYAHGVVQKPWLGDGACIVTYEHILKACRLIMFAGAFFGISTAIIVRVLL